MHFLGFSPPVTIEIRFADREKRKSVTVKKGETSEILPVYSANDPVIGDVVLKLQSGKKLEHTGIKVELVGQIELFFDRGNHFEFTSLVKEVEGPGTMFTSKSYPFEFTTVEKTYEAYNGINVRLRYLIRVSIGRAYNTTILKEQDFFVQNVQPEPDVNNTLKMEVGIEDCLHIEFEYNKSKYHLKDVIIGKILFLLVRIKIKHMEIEIKKRESTGSGPNLYNESETIAKFEIMDGAPVRGESIPVRLFLSAYDLTPTYRNVNNKFSVKYFLNLVLVDEDDRRYFKQQEIQLWRKDESAKPQLSSAEKTTDELHTILGQAGDGEMPTNRTVPSSSSNPNSTTTNDATQLNSPRSSAPPLS
mmetsp:Transcript_43942/g.71483  ORF Transcript_43942/g.71483 Transcript_43942/m.71483 type:complete len:360 (+) Transcript_43942:33-1112(+)